MEKEVRERNVLRVIEELTAVQLPVRQTTHTVHKQKSRRTDIKHTQFLRHKHNSHAYVHVTPGFPGIGP